MSGTPARQHDQDPLALFAIDASAPTPPFRQLHEQVVSAVADGRLLPGTRLPTVRALAAHLGLAVNTVAGAYRSLEAAGVVEGRGRAGTFVRLGDDPVEARAREIALRAATEFRGLGIARDRALILLGDAYDAG
ncbi:GntR family transcriptional regulator [Leucobacter soli]|nr:GntR family transcriptional regulator [Leucobacter soli]